MEIEAFLVLFVDHGLAQLDDGAGLAVGEGGGVALLKEFDDFVEVHKTKWNI